jgi:glycosyltransferase involved in cell wall biosynthesis
MKERLRVRVGKNYGARYNTHHRPDNVDLVPGPMTPLSRISLKLDSFALIGPGYDLIHSFNAIPLFTGTPFIVTFEDYCPRVPQDRYIEWLERRLREVLVSDRCLAIIAMSQYALRKFQRQHRNYAGLAKLLAKTHVIYPAMPATGMAPKLAGNVLRLLFVGLDFMRKGGPAVLEAHRRLMGRGIPVETTIVSALRWSERDYVGPPDPRRSCAVMNSIHGRGIVHHAGLPHRETTELMRRADYLLLPTIHDTFGFVSLEAMNCGTPAIATSTCAQNEVVEHGRSGFLLDFENDPVVGDWRWLYGQHKPGYVEAYWQAIQKLTDELVTTLSLAWEQRKDYEAMSAAAIARMAERFDVVKARHRLVPLYRLATPWGQDVHGADRSGSQAIPTPAYGDRAMDRTPVMTRLDFPQDSSTTSVQFSTSRSPNADD